MVKILRKYGSIDVLGAHDTFPLFFVFFMTLSLCLSKLLWSSYHHCKLFDVESSSYVAYNIKCLLFLLPQTDRSFVFPTCLRLGCSSIKILRSMPNHPSTSSLGRHACETSLIVPNSKHGTRILHIATT
jgi:hypothetical protein